MAGVAVRAGARPSTDERARLIEALPVLDKLLEGHEK